MRARRRLAAALAAGLLPRAAVADDAFGDMGPFYANLLHPVADPAQGVVLAGAAVFLARQPIETVRPAYAALAIGGGVRGVPWRRAGAFPAGRRHARLRARRWRRRHDEVT